MNRIMKCRCSTNSLLIWMRKTKENLRENSPYQPHSNIILATSNFPKTTLVKSYHISLYFVRFLDSDSLQFLCEDFVELLFLFLLPLLLWVERWSSDFLRLLVSLCRSERLLRSFSFMSWFLLLADLRECVSRFSDTDREGDCRFASSTSGLSDQRQFRFFVAVVASSSSQLKIRKFVPYYHNRFSVHWKC